MLKWKIKANLFYIITDPTVDVLVSIDCDTLFAQTGCAAELMSSLVDWKDTDPSIRVTTLSENEKGEITDVSLGTVAVHRHYSKDALFIWTKYITMRKPNFIKAMHDHINTLPSGQTNQMTVGQLTKTGPIDPLTSLPVHPPMMTIINIVVITFQLEALDKYLYIHTSKRITMYE